MFCSNGFQQRMKNLYANVLRQERPEQFIRRLLIDVIHRGCGKFGGVDVDFTRVEQNNAAVTYAGTWYTNNGTFNSGGSAVLSADKGARAEVGIPAVATT